MRFLVTGGAGFIGSNIVESLLERGHHVRVLDNFSTGKRENLAPFNQDIELIEGDIRSYHVVQQAVHGVNVVLHQAALPSVPRSINDPITSNEVNVTGTLNILEASRQAGVSKVVYASSSSVYGDNPELPKHEGMTPNPLSPYAVSKLAAEKYCQVFSKIAGLKTGALRYFTVFGPRQDPNSQYSAVIPKFITSMMQGKAPIIYGDGEQSRDFTYVANVVEANLLAATADCDGGLAMNCACNERTTLNDLAHSIAALLGTDIRPTYAEPRPGDIKHSLPTSMPSSPSSSAGPRARSRRP
jgi:UDP-glucose 4-epimerase